jgi:hypothetical protein
MTLQVTDGLLAARAEADRLGVRYHHRANEDTIRRLIAEASSSPSEPAQAVPAGGPKMGPGAVLTRKEYEKAEAQKRARNAGRLRRVQITCMDPTKKNWDGEVITVSSRTMGTYKKFVPYNGLPYHVPQAIYDELKSKKCTVFVNEKRGSETFRKGVLIDKYSIVDLPDLTPAELDDLAKKQAMADNGL